MASSLYIHVPFCRRRCIYCDFYSVIYADNIAAPYVNAITTQMGNLSQALSTIYIGGGTPTSLDRELFAGLLQAIRKRVPSVPEFTVEANPESLDDEKIELLLDAGVNRLSLGLQSLADQKLKSLGRIHSSKKAVESIYLAYKRGFKNISIDLIFGVWDEDMGAWEKELKEVARLPVTHISCYSLTYEKDTPLFSALRNKSIIPLEDDVVAAMYEAAVDLLSLGGFKQYEVSNYSKDDYQCRHNLNYWENGEYIGVGASAVSYIDGVRAKNFSDIKEYVRRYNDNKRLVESHEKLSPVKRARETAAVKMRTKEGIDFSWFKERTGFDFCELERKAIKELVEMDLIKYKKEDNIPSGIALKRKGFLFCDTVSSALL